MLGFYTVTGIIASVLINVAVYVISAISLFNIGNRCGVKYSWFAFVPILQFYIIGSICEEYVLFGYRVKQLPWIICAIMLLQTIFQSTIIGVLATILSLLVLHKFFYLFNPQRALLYTILCVFGMLPLAVILLLLKDAPIQMSAGAYQYPFANRL